MHRPTPGFLHEYYHMRWLASQLINEKQVHQWSLANTLRIVMVPTYHTRLQLVLLEQHWSLF